MTSAVLVWSIQTLTHTLIQPNQSSDWSNSRSGFDQTGLVVVQEFLALLLLLYKYMTTW